MGAHVRVEVLSRGVGRLRPLKPIVSVTGGIGVIVVAGYCTFKSVSFAGSLKFRGGLQVDSYVDLDIVNRQRLGSEQDSIGSSELSTRCTWG